MKPQNEAVAHQRPRKGDFNGQMSCATASNEGILLIDKEAGCSSFRIVEELRRLTGIQKIGHAGTLDPFATGVMVMLIGSSYTRRSDEFLMNDKQYLAKLFLGVETDSYDIDGQVTATSPIVPSFDDVIEALTQFQGEILQTPPMFSAKKVKGQKLCDLARKGVIIERTAAPVRLKTTFLRYEYPELELLVDCSKGTYIRSLAFDLGRALGCGAHLKELIRTRSGPFLLGNCIKQANLRNPSFDIKPHLILTQHRVCTLCTRM